MRSSIPCVFFSLFATVLSAKPKSSSTKDQHDLLRSILPDLSFEHALRKSRNPSLDALSFYSQRLQFLLSSGRVHVNLVSADFDFGMFKLSKKSFTPGDVARLGTEIAQLEPTDDGVDSLVVFSPGPSILVAYLYDEGETLRGRDISINVGLENLTLSTSRLEIWRKRVAFLRSADRKKETPHAAISHADLARTPTNVDNLGTLPLDPSKNALHLHKLAIARAAPYADRYESLVCAVHAHDHTLQAAFRRLVPTARLRSIYSISDFGRRAIRKVSIKEKFFKKGTRIIKFTDKSYYVAEDDGYISGELDSLRISGHIPFFALPFIVYPNPQES